MHILMIKESRYSETMNRLQNFCIPVRGRKEFSLVTIYIYPKEKNTLNKSKIKRNIDMDKTIHLKLK